jgi:hypothetical protein
MDDNEGCVGCGCSALAVGVPFTAMTVILAGQLGVLRAAWNALVVTISGYLLGLFGIIPFLGQRWYKAAAPGVIDWVFGLLGQDQNIQLKVPGFVNWILKWIVGQDALTGTFGSYTYAFGYSTSVAISVGIGALLVFGLIALLVGSNR